MTLNCLIIDDEPLAVKLLAAYVEKTPYLNLVGAYTNSIDAMSDLKNNNIDVVFLDIEMPEINGLEFAKVLPSRIKIILTTAYSQYAVEGYKINALAYLLKPIAYEDFKGAIRKVIEATLDGDSKSHSSGDEFFYVRSEYKLVQVRYEDILYIEGLKDYVKIYLDKGKEPITCLMNMKKLTENLPRPEFLRIHRSYIVHMPKVELIDKYRIVFNDTFLPISDSYRPAVQKYFDNHVI